MAKMPELTNEQAKNIAVSTLRAAAMIFAGQPAGTLLSAEDVAGTLEDAADKVALP